MDVPIKPWLLICFALLSVSNMVDSYYSRQPIHSFLHFSLACASAAVFLILSVSEEIKK